MGKQRVSSVKIRGGSRCNDIPTGTKPSRPCFIAREAYISARIFVRMKCDCLLQIVSEQICQPASIQEQISSLQLIYVDVTHCRIRFHILHLRVTQLSRLGRSADRRARRSKQALVCRCLGRVSRTRRPRCHRRCFIWLPGPDDTSCTALMIHKYASQRERFKRENSYE